jgi:hypothetical protein
VLAFHVCFFAFHHIGVFTICCVVVRRFPNEKGLISSHPAGRPSPAPFHFVSTTRSLTRRIKSQGSPGRQLTCSARKTFATLHSSSRWSCSPTITSAWDPLPEATFQLSHIPLLSHSLQTHPTKASTGKRSHIHLCRSLFVPFSRYSDFRRPPTPRQTLFCSSWRASSPLSHCTCVRPLRL